MLRFFNICTSASQEPASHGTRGPNTIDGHPSPGPSCTTTRCRSFPCLKPAPRHTCGSLGDSHAFLQFFSSQAFRIQSHPLVPWEQLLSCPSCWSPQKHTWTRFPLKLPLQEDAFLHISPSHLSTGPWTCMDCVMSLRKLLVETRSSTSVPSLFSMELSAKRSQDSFPNLLLPVSLPVTCTKEALLPSFLSTSPKWPRSKWEPSPPAHTTQSKH